MCVEGGSVRVRATCELNLLETHCSVGLVSWLPAQHTKHLNAQCPIDLACAPLVAPVSLSLSLPHSLYVSLFAYDTNTLEFVCCQQEEAASQSASTTDSQQLESPAATSFTSCNNNGKRDSNFNLCRK